MVKECGEEAGLDEEFVRKNLKVGLALLAFLLSLFLFAPPHLLPTFYRRTSHLTSGRQTSKRA